MENELSHLRIVNDSLLGHNTKVFFVDDKGVETEISHVITGYTIRGHVGDINSATLDVIKVKYAVLAKKS